MFPQYSGSMSSSNTQSNTRSCAKMELIESYGLTLADINNLIRHAISAADNVHPYNMVNTMMDFDETQSRRSNSGKQKGSRQSENGMPRFQNQNSFE